MNNFYFISIGSGEGFLNKCGFGDGSSSGSGYDESRGYGDGDASGSGSHENTGNCIALDGCETSIHNFTGACDTDGYRPGRGYGYSYKSYYPSPGAKIETLSIDRE